MTEAEVGVLKVPISGQKVARLRLSLTDSTDQVNQPERWFSRPGEIAPRGGMVVAV